VRFCDNIAVTDGQVGRLLHEREGDGHADNTIPYAGSHKILWVFLFLTHDYVVL